MAILTAISTYYEDGKPVIKTLKMRSLQSLRNHKGSDRAYFSFDLEADFTPLFHWNQHQINVFVVAEYESSKNVSKLMIKYLE